MATVDPSRWNVHVGDKLINNNIGYNCAENVVVTDGILTLEAKKERYMESEYTTAEITTLAKLEITCGRIESKIKMPYGHGIWAAFWMLPVDNVYGAWPRSGEIDIAEKLDTPNNRIHGSIHWGTNSHLSVPYDLNSANYQDDYHVFAVQWNKNQFCWYMDDICYYEQKNWSTPGGDYPAPFDVDFYIILDIAVIAGVTASFPQTMYVDYVKVYQG